MMHILLPNSHQYTPLTKISANTGPRIYRSGPSSYLQFNQKSFFSSFPLNPVWNLPQVFVHGDELDNYIKEVDGDILPADFDGKAPVIDCHAIANKLFGSEDTALWDHSRLISKPRVIVSFILDASVVVRSDLWFILKLG